MKVAVFSTKYYEREYLNKFNIGGKHQLTYFDSSLTEESTNLTIGFDAGEFSNIKNNPVWQTKTFPPVKARYLKLQALHNTQDNDAVGYAEFDVITD